MIDIQKLAKLVWLKVASHEEAGLLKDFENILHLLDKLGEVDTSSVETVRTDTMLLGQIGADVQMMDKNLFFSNISHPIRNGQMVVKHKGRGE